MQCKAGLQKAVEHKTIDVDGAFAEFNSIIKYFVTACIPQHTVCIKPKDPAFVTPYILRKRNIAMRRGQTEKAADLSKKVNQFITEHRKENNAATSDIKQLWSLLKHTNNWGKKMNQLLEYGSAEEINKHFASIATDLDYNKNSIISELNRHISGPTSAAAAEACYSHDFIAVALSRVRKTSTGSDCIPCWVLKECASELCEIISVLINFSVNEGCVPACCCYTCTKSSACH